NSGVYYFECKNDSTGMCEKRLKGKELRDRELRGNANDEITGIREVKHRGEYVYDLQTGNHHFQAGVGQIIVHNTDSVMVELTNMKGKTKDERENRRLLMSRKEEFETVANAINIEPMHAEFEKGMLMALF